MADTAEKTKTKEQVKAMLADGKSVKEIAEKLNKTPATIYVHQRNLKAESGDKTPARRGRPPKLTQKSDGDSKTAESKVTSPKASTNGNSARFPKIQEAIEAELKDARARVTVLEKMLTL